MMWDKIVAGEEAPKGWFILITVPDVERYWGGCGTDPTLSKLRLEYCRIPAWSDITQKWVKFNLYI